MGKLRKDQKEGLIGKLAALLSGVSADEIDQVVAGTKYHLEKESREAKNRERVETFDRQVKTLLDKGYPEAAGMEKDQFLGYVNPLKDKFELGDIIIIPERLVSTPKQMSMVKLNGKTGYTFLNFGVLRQADGVETPNVPYLKQGRYGLTVEEGIAIITHGPETLNDQYIDLTGSRCDSGYVPRLWLCRGRPCLGCRRYLAVGVRLVR